MSKILSNPKAGTFGDTAVDQYPLSYVNDRFVVGLNYNANIGYSTNGLYNWQFSDKGTNGNGFLTNPAIYCNGVYIIPCVGLRQGQLPRVTNIYFYSTDGVNWEQKTLPTMSRYMGATNGEEFILVGSDSSATSIVIYQSTNGIDWTDITTKATFGENIGYPASIVYNDKDESYCILLTEAQERTNVLTLCCGTSNSFATTEVTTPLNYAVSDRGTLLMAGDSIIYYDTAYPYIYRANASGDFLTSEWEQIELEYESNKLARDVCVGYNPGFILIAYRQVATVGTGTVTTQRLVYIEDDTLVQNIIWNNNQSVGTVQAIAGNGNRFVITTNTTKLYAVDIIDEVALTPRRSFNYQDIQSTDRESWTSFVSKMKSNDFTGAQTIAQSMTGKQLNAKQLNDLFTFLVENQNLSDPTFKSSKIATSPTVPTGLGIGQMYFKEYV